MSGPSGAMSSVGLELTNACPWRCETCLPASGLPRVRELTTERWQYLLALLADVGFTAVCFSGGEPLVYPGVHEVLATAAALRLRVSLFTSGSALDDRALDALLAVRAEVVVSLDGADPGMHDGTRGGGSFDTAIAALHRLRDAGARSSVTCTVTRRNRHVLDALVELTHRVGASRLTFNEVVRGGRAREHWPTLGLDPVERQELRDWFVRAAPGWPGGAALAIDDSCWVDGGSLYITAEGRCYVCSEVAQFRPRNRFGDLTGDRFADTSTIERLKAVNLASCSCRYDMVVSGSYLLVLDSPRPCVGLDHPVAVGLPVGAN